MSRTLTAGLVGLMMIGLVGCEGSQDIVTPNYEQDIAAMQSSASVDCPDFADVCASMVEQIESGCPEEEFSNHGQLQSCRVHAVNELLKDLPTCYTSSEQLALKKAVMEAVGLGDFVGHRTPLKLEYTEN